MRWVAIYIAAVLAVSWSYAAYVFSSPERMSGFLWVMWIPGLVALAIRMARRDEWRSILSPLTAPIRGRAVAFALLYTVGVVTLCAGLAWCLGLAEFHADRLQRLRPEWRDWISLSNWSLMLGEEYGWRGFLLPEASRNWGRRKAALLVGAIWAIWHAPFLYWLSATQDTGPALAVMSVQIIAVLAVSTPFAYTYFMSGSILPPMLFHFVWNTYNPIVLGNLYRNRPGIFEGNILLLNGEGVLGAGLGIIASLYLLSRLERLSRT